MELLTAVAAFAVAMILLSTLVTGIVEIAIRVLSLRAHVLATSVFRMVQDEILPCIKKLTSKEETEEAEPKEAEPDAEAIVTALTRNPVLVPAGKSLSTQGLSGYVSCRKRIDALSTFAFLQRLAKSDIGKQLVKEADERLRPILLDFSRTHERYAAASREAFRKRAHAMSLAIAVGLAFIINVDAVRLFQHLSDNREAREALIAQAEAAVEQNRLALEGLESRIAAGDDAAEQTAEGITAAVADLRSQIQQLAGLGLPIGWGHFPYADETAAPVPEDSKIPTLPEWFLGTLLAGFLIGLGGPFWFKVYSNLSQVLPALGALGGGSKELVSAPAADAPAVQEAEVKEDIVTTFRIAAGEPVQ
jgi:hypothetical protein